MKTLKHAALALLIPFGWQISEAAAYIKSVESIDSAQERGLTQSCSRTVSSQPDFDRFVGKPRGHSKRLVAPVASPDTTSLHHHRHNPADACRLDIDLIETD